MTGKASSWGRDVSNLQALGLNFVLWKALLFAIALSSPGPGYDTSTQLFFEAPKIPQTEEPHNVLHTILRRLVHKLIRWDAIWFTATARNGYIFEQAWAWSLGFTSAMKFLGQYMPSYCTPYEAEALAGLIMSNAAHLAAVFTLYFLSRTILPSNVPRHISYTAAALHIVSPAGIFLSSSYTESLFALANFSGVLLYLKGRSIACSSSLLEVPILLSGICLGLSAVLRGNGVIGGSLFFYEAVILLFAMLKGEHSLLAIRQLLATGIAGVLTGAGFLVPQWIAYREYCVIGGNERPWCSYTIPSMYSWVQSHYWNVGFLRYWTLSNLPLFLMAIPVVASILWSGSTMLRMDLQKTTLAKGKSEKSNTLRTERQQQPRSAVDISSNIPLLPLVLPELILSVLTLTSFHVQIINRLSSGYPIWYICIALHIASDRNGSSQGQFPVPSSWIVKFMVMYSLIQSALFANFLPPA